MKLLIIFFSTVVSVFGLPSKEINSRNIVVPAGRPQGRITNANDAAKKQFPYQVGLMLQFKNGESAWCGGCVISTTSILTAAHCVQDVISVEVYMGSVKRRRPKVKHEVSAENIIIHSKWNNITFENDIAIIKIPETTYTDFIQPVELAASLNSTYSGETVVVSGWGKVTDSATDPTNHLQYANMTVIPNFVCRRQRKIYSSNICVVGTGGVSPCDGDSGGPLVVQSSKILVGIGSMVAMIGCEKSKPVIYTRVTSYLDWIQLNSNVVL